VGNFKTVSVPAEIEHQIVFQRLQILLPETANI
jgi:hypothetical protein